jgi:quercetin dioxygenase-like cupin family protein
MMHARAPIHYLAHLAAAVLLGLPMLTAAQQQDAKVSPLLTKDLTGIDGKEVTMVTVEYPPGGTTPKHRHNAHTFVYVLEGSIVMQLEGGPAVTLEPGQTFYESPAHVHAVSRNASTSKPARFLVFFVKDRGAPTLVPMPAGAR